MSAPTKSPGKLLILGASIGNSDDFPKRSLQALSTADILVFEEDAPARQALKAAGIHRTYFKLTEHNEAVTLEAVADAFHAGQTVTYMSDQGMPNLADPGRQLLEIAERMKVPVTVIPGPSSLSAAIAACRFVQGGFYFYGFLPRQGDERRTCLKGLESFPDPIILFDTPYRRQAVLQDVQAALGDQRKVFVALDITGPNEAYVDGSIRDVIQKLSAKSENDNFVLVIANASGAGRQQSTSRSRPKKT